MENYQLIRDKQRRNIRRTTRYNDAPEVDCMDEVNMITFSFTMEDAIYDNELKTYLKATIKWDDNK